ncbi:MULTISPECIES: hypothetical protein [unclassified Nocardioides]|uniref:hypothetical protein n=1 Tax=unclassified Nocardioides TaxID=2615069 RepID=UPI0030148FC6
MSREELVAFTEPVSREEARRYVADAPNLSEEQFDDALNENLRDALEAYGLPAPLGRSLSMRVKGNLRRNGGLSTEVTEDLLDGLTKQVRGAADKDASGDALVLDLVGVGNGSTVLFFEPSKDVTDAEHDLDVESDPLDSALRRVFALHDLAESQGDMRQYSNRADLLKGFQVLTDTLRAHDLELEMSWQDARGRRRRTNLSKPTLEWVSHLWEKQPEERVFGVSGRVVALSLAGTFSVKVAPHRTARRYDIHVPGDESDVIRLGLDLGENVDVLLRERVESNKVGVKGAERYEFVRLLSEGEELPQ